MLFFSWTLYWMLWKLTEELQVSLACSMEVGVEVELEVEVGLARPLVVWHTSSSMATFTGGNSVTVHLLGQCLLTAI
ncbi:hypothetical protein CRUP_038850 [Coryphaenoides rupestris]|nr:hypothetical protein CRUP_038850 [Coryphaenoides rupestris]